MKILKNQKVDRANSMQRNEYIDLEDKQALCREPNPHKKPKKGTLKLTLYANNFKSMSTINSRTKFPTHI